MKRSAEQHFLDMSDGCLNPLTLELIDKQYGYPLKLQLGCHHRFDCECSSCAQKWRSKIFLRLLEAIPSFLDPKFLTLTLRYDTSQGICHHIKLLWKFRNQLFKELSRPQDYPDKNGVIVHSPGYIIDRWFGVIELPNHLHMVIDSPYIPWSLIVHLWIKITGDSRGVDIRPVRGETPHKMARYLSKYMSKLGRQSAAVVDSLKGFHLVQSHGLTKPKSPFIIDAEGVRPVGFFGWRKPLTCEFEDKLGTWNRETSKRDRFLRLTSPKPSLDKFI